MSGDEERQVFVFAEISDRSRCVDNISSVERELDVSLLSATKKLFFNDLDDMRGEGCRENVDCGLLRQFWQDSVQHAIGWPERRDAVSFYARKK